MTPCDDTAYGIEVGLPRVVLDTNVMVAAFRSRLGMAFRLVQMIGRAEFELALSVPLVLEYEDALHRATQLSPPEIKTLLSFWCSVGHLQKVFFLWRPLLRDPKDDMVLELAVAARARQIVTFNVRDFSGAEQFGIEILQPRIFLEQMGETTWQP